VPPHGFNNSGNGSAGFRERFKALSGAGSLRCIQTTGDLVEIIACPVELRHCTRQHLRVDRWRAPGAGAGRADCNSAKVTASTETGSSGIFGDQPIFLVAEPCRDEPCAPALFAAVGRTPPRE
jgi:hypothetical protein